MEAALLFRFIFACHYGLGYIACQAKYSDIAGWNSSQRSAVSDQLRLEYPVFSTWYLAKDHSHQSSVLSQIRPLFSANRRAIVARIKEGADYEGVRVRFNAMLAGARIPMQIDIGFGDVIVP